MLTLHLCLTAAYVFELCSFLRKLYNTYVSSGLINQDTRPALDIRGAFDATVPSMTG